MEPMEFGCDEEIQRDREILQALEPSMNNQLDVSDMDVDALSPCHGSSAARSSTSFEHISRALCSVLSLNNVSDGSDCETCFSGEKSVGPLSSAPSHRLTSYVTDWQATKTPIVRTIGFGKAKPRYGIPKDDKNFAHFPDPAAGSSLRNRQLGHSSTPVKKPEHKSMNTSNANQQNHLKKQLKCSFEIQSKGKSSCLCFMLQIILVIVIAFAAFYLVMLYAASEQEKCQLSRHFNRRILQMELETNVFGQHLAARTVPDKIEEYFSKLDTSVHIAAASPGSGDLLKCKPLVMSFDGWTGVGKNYISRFISQTFQYSRIINYIIPLNFPHKSFENTYRKQIRQWIIGNFTQCTVNIIVLDEMDKALPGVVEGLTEAIHELTLPCSSASPIMLLLLSNTHANDINRAVLKFLLDSPTNKREQLTHEHFSSIFISDVKLWSSLLVNEQLIDAAVPFLPLEREHVIQCIKRDLVSKRYSTDLDTVNKVLQEMSFSTFGNVHFSQTGCKRVADKVDLVMFEKHQF